MIFYFQTASLFSPECFEDSNHFRNYILQQNYKETELFFASDLLKDVLLEEESFKYSESLKAALVFFVSSDKKEENGLMLNWI